MIVKHETRIRTLETKNKEQEKQLMSQVRFVRLNYVFTRKKSSNLSNIRVRVIFFQGIHLNNNGHSGEDLDPDEV